MSLKSFFYDIDPTVLRVALVSASSSKPAVIRLISESSLFHL